MNRNMLLKVAQAIEDEPRHFDIDTWVSTPDGNEGDFIKDIPVVLKCGTTMCIGGHAVHQAMLAAKKQKKRFRPSSESTARAAASILDMDPLDAHRLFMPGSWNYWTNADPRDWQEVVKVLRILADRPNFDFLDGFIDIHQNVTP